MKKIKNRRSINEIGKIQFGFEFVEEENIYLYSCGLVKNSKVKKMKCKKYTYLEWKDSIQKKYKQKDEDFLEEFSRYLRNLINISYPILKYNQIAVGGLISVVFSIVGTEFIKNLNIQSYLTLLENYLLNLLMFFMLIVVIIFVLHNTYEPVKVQSMRIAFLKDYKEVIDELLKCKKDKCAL